MTERDKDFYDWLDQLEPETKRRLAEALDLDSAAPNGDGLTMIDAAVEYLRLHPPKGPKRRSQ